MFKVNFQDFLAYVKLAKITFETRLPEDSVANKMPLITITKK